MQQIQPQTILIGAQRQQVWQALTAYGRPSPAWLPGLAPELVEEGGTVLVVRFLSRVMGRRVATLERVRLYPEHRITFEHLEGTLENFREEIALDEVEGLTRLDYRGDLMVGTRMAARFLERRVAAPLFNREMRRTLARWKVAFEAAAASSGAPTTTPTSTAVVGHTPLRG